MKRLLFASILCLALVPSIYAQLSIIYVNSVMDADVVIVGSLTEISESFGKCEASYITVKCINFRGTIVVNEVITKNVQTRYGRHLATGDKVLVKWSGFRPHDCGLEIAKEMNIRRIWFLRQGTWPIQINETDTPPVRNLIDVEAMLIDSPVRPIVIDIVPPGKPTSGAPSVLELDPAWFGTTVWARPDSVPRGLIRGLIVFIIALILYRLLYRSRIKIKIKKKKKKQEQN